MSKVSCLLLASGVKINEINEIDQTNERDEKTNVLRLVADVDDLSKDIGFKPSTPIEEGIRKFVECYRENYNE